MFNNFIHRALDFLERDNNHQPPMTNYLIAYDISSDALRDKAATLLQQHGCRRVQKSVFLAPQFDIKELRALKAALRGLLGGKLAPGESLIGIPLSPQQLADCLWEGSASSLSTDQDDALHLLI
jgi:CRISPR-associated protein Cas2